MLDELGDLAEGQNEKGIVQTSRRDLPNDLEDILFGPDASVHLEDGVPTRCSNLGRELGVQSTNLLLVGGGQCSVVSRKVEGFHDPFSSHERLGGGLADLGRLNPAGLAIDTAVGCDLQLVSVASAVRVGVVKLLELALALLLQEKLGGKGQDRGGAGRRSRSTYRLVRLLPDTNRLVVRTGDDKVPAVGDGEGPNLSRVTSELLDALELEASEGQLCSAPVSSEMKSHLISIPVLDHPVLADAPEKVGALLEGDAHDALLVGEERPVAISKVETPNLDVLVGRAGYDELVVVRDVEGKNGELFGGDVRRGRSEAAK